MSVILIPCGYVFCNLLHGFVVSSRKGRPIHLSYASTILQGFKEIFQISRRSIVVSIPACHAGDRGSIPRDGAFALVLVSLSIYLSIYP